jgi:xanthine dehydrogenase accessory factor
LRQMRDAGLTEAMLARLVCPIGIPGVEGKDPAVIAASTAVQLLMQSQPLAVGRGADGSIG